MLVPSGLKSRERTEEKVKDDYGGRFGKIFDLVRASVKCRSATEVLKVWQALQKISGVEVVRCKNRFRDSLFTGYRDMLLNIRLELPGCGVFHIVELQIHQKSHLVGLKINQKSHLAELQIHKKSDLVGLQIHKNPTP